MLYILLGVMLWGFVSAKKFMGLLTLPLHWTFWTLYEELIHHKKFQMNVSLGIIFRFFSWRKTQEKSECFKPIIGPSRLLVLMLCQLNYIVMIWSFLWILCWGWSWFSVFFLLPLSGNVLWKARKRPILSMKTGNLTWEHGTESFGFPSYSKWKADIKAVEMQALNNSIL